MLKFISVGNHFVRKVAREVLVNGCDRSLIGERVRERERKRERNFFFR